MVIWCTACCWPSHGANRRIQLAVCPCLNTSATVCDADMQAPSGHTVLKGREHQMLYPEWLKPGITDCSSSQKSGHTLLNSWSEPPGAIIWPSVKTKKSTHDIISKMIMIMIMMRPGSTCDRARLFFLLTESPVSLILFHDSLFDLFWLHFLNKFI